MNIKLENHEDYPGALVVFQLSHDGVDLLFASCELAIGELTLWLHKAGLPLLTPSDKQRVRRFRHVARVRRGDDVFEVTKKTLHTRVSEW